MSTVTTNELKRYGLPEDDTVMFEQFLNDTAGYNVGKIDSEITRLDGNIDNKVKLNNESIQNVNFIGNDGRITGAIIGSQTYTFAQRIKIYSVRFSGSNPQGTREDDAVGMIAEVGVDSQVVRNDFDSVSFFNRPIVCGDYQEDGTFKINAYKGEPTFATDGSNGNVWRECTPFYYKGDLDNYVSVCSMQLEGYSLAPGFKNGYEKVYLPCYFASLDNNLKMASISGKYPLTGSCNSFMVEARKYNTKAHLETIDWLISDYILQLVEFANKDVENIMFGCQNLDYNSTKSLSVVGETNVNRVIVSPTTADKYVIGQTICIGTSQNSDNIVKFATITDIINVDANKGLVFDGDAVNIQEGYFLSSRPYRCGSCDNVVASSGSPVSNTSGKYPCVWRGKENPWGDGFSTLSNVLTKRYGDGSTIPYTYKPYYLKNPTLYSNGTITSDYAELSYNLPTSDGYVKTLGTDIRYPFVKLTDVVGGGSTTYHGAYYYYPRYDICSVMAGGYFAFGRNCSPVYFRCSYAPSSSNLTFLARLFVYRS